MFNRYSALLLLFMLFQTAPVNAHSGGHGDIVLKDSQAISVAYSVVKQFTQLDPGLGFGKLDSSWGKLPEAAQRVHKKHHDYLIIAFTNKNQTLYVLMSVSGDIYDANMTGQFEGLK